MKELITNLGVKAFLDDFSQNSQTIILEEGKEKNELIDIAKKRGVIVKDSTDLGILKTIYAFTDKANDNGAILPEKAMLKVLPTMIGKPMNRNHIRDQIRGVYVDYKYVQAKKMIIAYATFFKSIFEEDWEEAKKLQKQGRLATSFEIWSPKDERKYISEYTYEMHNMEIAGGGLLFNSKEDPIPPAFPGAKVLSLAKECMPEKYLVCASKYCNEELICSEAVPTTTPVSIMVTCKNCNTPFDYTKVSEVSMGAVKCPNCKSILDQEGTVLFPPQNIDFHLSCPNDKCNLSNWIVESDSESKAKIKCLGCNRKYELNFNKDAKRLFDFPLASVLETLPSKTFTCPQCGASTGLSNVRHVMAGKVGLHCSKCDLDFNKSLIDAKKRTVSSILEIVSVIKEEGGKEMDKQQTENATKELTTEFVKFYRQDLELIISEKAKRLTYKERLALPDSQFAIVIDIVKIVKKKKKKKKLSMFPIYDEAHVRNALARLGQETVKKTLSKLGVNIEDVKDKILKKAKELKITDLIKKSEKAENVSIIEQVVTAKFYSAEVSLLKARIKKLISKVVKFKKGMSFISDYENELASLKEDNTKSLKAKDKEFATIKKDYEATKKTLQEEVKLYKDNGVIIAERKSELGDFAEDLSDKQLLDETEYESARIKMVLVNTEEEEEKKTEEAKIKVNPEKSPAENSVDRIAFNND